MRELAPDVYLLDGFPPYMVNIYVIDDVLLDAGIRWDERRIFRQLNGHTLRAHALTHVHPDHQGMSKQVCEAYDIPLWVGADDADAMEAGTMQGQIPRNTLTRLQDVFWTGAAHPVAKRLTEGDTVAGFTVIDVPGHSPGQVAYWRASDRVLIAGDVLNNMNMLTMQTGLHEPPSVFTVDAAQNRASARKLAALNPRMVLFGHGEPLLDGGRFVEFVATLPA